MGLDKETTDQIVKLIEAYQAIPSTSDLKKGAAGQFKFQVTTAFTLENTDKRWIELMKEAGKAADESQQKANTTSHLTKLYYDIISLIRAKLEAANSTALTDEIANAKKQFTALRLAYRATNAASQDLPNVVRAQQNLDDEFRELVHLGVVNPLLGYCTTDEVRNDIFPWATTAPQLAVNMAKGAKDLTKSVLPTSWYKYLSEMPGVSIVGDMVESTGYQYSKEYGIIPHLPVVAQKNLYNDPNPDSIFTPVEAETKSEERPDDLNKIAAAASKLVNNLEIFLTISPEEKWTDETIKSYSTELKNSERTLDNWLDLVIKMGNEADEIQENSATFCSKRMAALHAVRNELLAAIKEHAPNGYAARLKKEADSLAKSRAQLAKDKRLNILTTADIEKSILKQCIKMGYIGDESELLSLRHSTLKLLYPENKYPREILPADGNSIYIPAIFWNTYPTLFETSHNKELTAARNAKKASDDIVALARHINSLANPEQFATAKKALETKFTTIEHQIANFAIAHKRVKLTAELTALKSIFEIKERELVAANKEKEEFLKETEEKAGSEVLSNINHLRMTISSLKEGFEKIPNPDAIIALSEAESRDQRLKDIADEIVSAKELLNPIAQKILTCNKVQHIPLTESLDAQRKRLIELDLRAKAKIEACKRLYAEPVEDSPVAQTSQAEKQSEIKQTLIVVEEPLSPVKKGLIVEVESSQAQVASELKSPAKQSLGSTRIIHALIGSPRPQLSPQGVALENVNEDELDETPAPSENIKTTCESERMELYKELYKLRNPKKGQKAFSDQQEKNYNKSGEKFIASIRHELDASSARAVSNPPASMLGFH